MYYIIVYSSENEFEVIIVKYIDEFEKDFYFYYYFFRKSIFILVVGILV